MEPTHVGCYFFNSLLALAKAEATNQKDRSFLLICRMATVFMKMVELFVKTRRNRPRAPQPEPSVNHGDRSQHARARPD
jgi:hypothetical protein